MPYNTRRKSLSLSSLGIHVPVNRSSSNSNKDNNNNHTHTNMSTKSRLSSEALPRPSKKVKRSYGDSPSSSSSPTTVISTKAAASSQKCDSTPPQSPAVHTSIEADETEFSSAPEVKPIDLTGIKDEIVEAVILRLQETRNRPQLVKELATILMGKLTIVQQ